jgi:hypothetical protein
MSRGLLLTNVLVGGLGCLFAVGILYDVLGGRSLPPPPVPRASQSTAEAAEQPVPSAPISTFQIIAAKNMFSPARSETMETPGAAAATAGVKPILHGVLIDGDRSRAYLEEPPARQIFGYAVGDRIAGGRLDAIEQDRVVILRPEGRLEVLLQDPSKPRAGAPSGTNPVGQPGRSYPGFSRVPSSGPTPPSAPAPPPAPTAPAAPTTPSAPARPQ